MKRYIASILLTCSVMLLSACAAKQEAAPGAESRSSEREAPQPQKPGIETVDGEASGEEPAQREAHPAPEPIVPTEPTVTTPKLIPSEGELKREAGPSETSTTSQEETKSADDASDLAPRDDAPMEGKKSSDQPAKPTTNSKNRLMNKPSPRNAGPAAKDAPCDPEDREDCDPSLLRKLPGR